MLVRVNEGLIRSYKPVLVLPAEANNIIGEILEKGTCDTDSWRRNHEQNGKTVFNLTADGYCKLTYSNSNTVSRETYTSPAPFTLYFAAKSGIIIPNKKYCDELKNTYFPVSSVLQCGNVQLVADILSALENNPELSDNFIKTYHIDLWYLQRLLRTVNFECIGNPVSDLTTDALERRAQDDTETAKRLHLVLPGIPGFER